MNATEIVLFIVSILLIAGFIVLRTMKTSYLALLLKTLASLSLVATGVMSIALTITTTPLRVSMGLVVIGLLFGMIGDIYLDLKVLQDNDTIYLNTGMASFTLGHICYFSAFSIFAVQHRIDLLLPILLGVGIALVLSAGTMLSSKKLGLDFGKFYWQGAGYAFILNFMMVFTLILAIMGASWIVFIGLLLFLASDLVLSMQYFGGKIASKPLIAINHGLYYAAQLMILLFIILL